jgi:hypothetical protein
MYVSVRTYVCVPEMPVRAYSLTEWNSGTTQKLPNS